MKPGRPFIKELAELIAELDGLPPQLQEPAAMFCLEHLFRWMIHKEILKEDDDSTEGMTRQ